ncbi:Hypothetical protein CAP_3923 [Chondromyces apiculatus DSM 436]|uniref:SnoaL-like domain-containing protein n=2 Tax=Chondromyces apiculatus TaxID=51 RepID=A0A017TGL6_9BACT|nr:Hypothetical protein CAP_3923 [Chondromyces apiculatus DSM 436]
MRAGGLNEGVDVMAGANVELVQQVYAAMGRRDLEALFRMIAEDVKIVQSNAMPWGGCYEGHAGMREFFGKLGAKIKSAVAVERYIEAGEQVVAIGRTQGATLATGKTFDVPVAHVWTVKEGKVTELRPYIDHPTMEPALET